MRRQVAARSAALANARWPDPGTGQPARTQDLQLTAEEELCLCHVALCYGHVLQLGKSHGAERMRLLLRLLQLLAHHDIPQARWGSEGDKRFKTDNLTTAACR